MPNEPYRITWAEWQEIRKAPDIKDRFEFASEPGKSLLQGLLGKLDGRDLYITDFWENENSLEEVVPKVEASLVRLQVIVDGAYHQGAGGVAGEDDIAFLRDYFNVTQELLVHARNWAGGLDPEEGYIGPHRYALWLADTVHKLDKLEGCTCPDDDSGDLEEGCPVHDD